MAQVDDDKPHVVIIGAGMAGLSAALRLVKTGMFEVVVMEAMDRPGGRIHSTHDFGPDEVVEIGANWIHGADGNPLYELARKNNLLMTQDSDYDEDSSSDDDSNSNTSSNCHSSNESQGKSENIHIREDGTIVPLETIQKICMWYNNISIQSANVDSHAGCSTVEEYFRLGFDEILTREGILDGEDLHLHRLVIRWLIALDCLDIGHSNMNDVALLHYNDYHECPGEYLISLGKKGFGGVVDLFVKALPVDTIKYSSPVEQIVWNQANSKSKKPVVIYAKDHPPITADHVIITASIGFLKENHLGLFQPALPADKQRAMETLGFGTVDKIFLKYKEPFWKNLRDGKLDGIQLLWEKDLLDSSGQDDINDSNCLLKITGFDTVEKHDDALCSWVCGKEAQHMETLTDDQVAKACTDVLRRFLKMDVPLPSRVLVSRWHSNPYFRGSYAAYLPHKGTGEEYDIMSRLVCSELSEMPLLLFAGEAFHKGFQSTVHGAMVTGECQADRLIEFYRRKIDV